MSEKRFTFYYERGNEIVIEDNGKRLSNKQLVDLLNKQQDIISQLQDLCGKSDYENAKLRIENKKFKEENEQLRQQHQRLYNYFRDYLEDEMSAENFGEMWDNVKEDERWNDERET